MIVTDDAIAPTGPTVKALLASKRRKRTRYKATHMVLLYDDEITGMAQGLRGVHLLKVGRAWVYLVETGEADQVLRKCELETWKTLMRSKTTKVL